MIVVLILSIVVMVLVVVVVVAARNTYLSRETRTRHVLNEFLSLS